MIKYAKISSDGTMSTTVAPEGGELLITTLLNDGFLPYDLEDRPDDDMLGELEGYELHHQQYDDRIVGYYEVVDIDMAKVAAKIETLKVELAASDYKVVKNQELQMLGFALEYDAAELHAEREPLREAIRELEGYIS